MVDPTYVPRTWPSKKVVYLFIFQRFTLLFYCVEAFFYFTIFCLSFFVKKIKNKKCVLQISPPSVNFHVHVRLSPPHPWAFLWADVNKPTPAAAPLVVAVHRHNFFEQKNATKKWEKKCNKIIESFNLHCFLGRKENWMVIRIEIWNNWILHNQISIKLTRILINAISVESTKAPHPPTLCNIVQHTEDINIR